MQLGRGFQQPEREAADRRDQEQAIGGIRARALYPMLSAGVREPAALYAAMPVQAQRGGIVAKDSPSAPGCRAADRPEHA
jgi:hypothetical protein